MGKQVSPDAEQAKEEKPGRFGMMAQLAIPDVPGMPKMIHQTRNIFTGRQKGTISVNTANNPHWNDVLVYAADASLVRFNGIDFYNDEEVTYLKKTRKGEMRYNVCCWKKCCLKTESKTVKSTHITFNSTDGAHKIRLEHQQGPEFVAGKRGCCAGCYMCTPLCISGCCCKPCCKLGTIDFTKLKPETFEVIYDDKLVATIEVQPGIQKGTLPQDQMMARATTVKDSSGSELFYMNEVDNPESSGPKYRCCACPCPCFECCKPCCCPMCMPFCGGLRCPRCKCGPCQWCCDQYCKCIACYCGCIPCIRCCQMYCNICSSCCDKCCAICRKPCCKCGVKEYIENVAGVEPFALPSSGQHQAHRFLYPLSTHKDTEVFGWATYTHLDDPTQSHRATLAVDPEKYTEGEAPPEVLGALPLLIDLARGSVGGDREEWTFEPRIFMNFFNPAQVVNFWPRAEVLQSVVSAHSVRDIINPLQGDIAPKQHTMHSSGMDEETTKLLRKAHRHGNSLA